MPEESDGFDKLAHEKHVPWHSGKRGHYCCEWDGLYICEDCAEFDCCTCEFPEEVGK